MNLSWPKMEKILYDNNLISKVSDKFTYGGGADYLKRGTRYRKIYGGDRKRVSIDSLMISLYPNKKMDDLFILYGLPNDEVLNDSTGTILKTSINQRISFYEKSCPDGSLSCFDAYVNVGGGVASFGYKGKNKLKDNFGYVKANDALDILPSFEKRNSVMAKFAESNIALINITEIEKLIKGTDIGYFNSSIIAELDQIGNGRWDKEGFKWSQNLNGSPEAFIDLNQNNSDVTNNDLIRPKKLLLKKKEIKKISHNLKTNGLTVIPLDIHFNKKSFAK